MTVSVLTPTIPERTAMLEQCRGSVQTQVAADWQHLVGEDRGYRGCAGHDIGNHLQVARVAGEHFRSDGNRLIGAGRVADGQRLAAGDSLGDAGAHGRFKEADDLGEPPRRDAEVVDEVRRQRGIGGARLHQVHEGLVTLLGDG